MTVLFVRQSVPKALDARMIYRHFSRHRLQGKMIAYRETSQAEKLE